MALHVLLGGNGTIASDLIPVLVANKQSIRLVSRNPKRVDGTETFAADLLDQNAVHNAVKGADIVYLLIGLTYNADVWKRDWPVIMQNVINACKQSKAKLIFFDNVYMYGKVDGEMTETTPYNPVSQKGKVRVVISQMLQKEMEAGTIEAVIGRAADFYGPGVTDKSAPAVYVFSNLKKGKKAQWPINANVPRSFTYVPDAARALYLLSTKTEAFGQVWHLPSTLPALTGRGFVRLAAKYMHASSDKPFVLPKFVLKIIGWFNPFVKELYEMTYQDEFAYQLSSAKFEKSFNFKPTSYEEGIKATAEWFAKQST